MESETSFVASPFNGSKQPVDDLGLRDLGETGWLEPLFTLEILRVGQVLVTERREHHIPEL